MHCRIAELVTFLRHSVWLAAATAAFPLASGCGEFRRAKECTALSKTVSAWLSAGPTPNLGASEPHAIAREARATADRYEELDRRLAALEIESEELVPHVASYRSMAQKSAGVLDEVASALERKDGELARRLRVEFDATAKAEDALVARINAVCKR